MGDKGGGLYNCAELSGADGWRAARAAPARGPWGMPALVIKRGLVFN